MIRIAQAAITIAGKREEWRKQERQKEKSTGERQDPLALTVEKGRVLSNAGSSSDPDTAMPRAGHGLGSLDPLKRLFCKIWYNFPLTPPDLDSNSPGQISPV
jgi:hypothetical protein